MEKRKNTFMNNVAAILGCQFLIKLLGLAYNLIIIKRMDESSTCLLLKFKCFLICIVICSRYQPYLCTQGLCCLDFTDRCSVRHADDTLYAHLCCRQSHTLSVVPCTAGNNPRFLLLICQLTYLVVGSSQLEASCHLQVFSLQINLCTA